MKTMVASPGLAGQQVTSAINWRHRQDGNLLFGEEYNTLNYSDELKTRQKLVLPLPEWENYFKYLD